MLTKLALRWKASVYMLMLVVVIFGVQAYMNLPKEASPEVKIPYVVISSSYEGAAPADVEALITLPIERNLKGLSGVKEVTSRSSEGYSLVFVEYMAGENLSDALQSVKDKVDIAKRDLPSDMKSDPAVFDISTSDFPVMVVSVSGDVDERVLKKVSDELKEAFESLQGVQEVEISGLRDRIVLVEFDYGRLQAYNLNPIELATALQQENVNIPGGTIDIGKGKYLLRTPGEFTNPAEIDRIVLTTRNGYPIYLKDVAKVTDAFDDKDSYARLNGKSTVSLSIMKRTGENIIDMGIGVKKIIEAAEQILPPTISVSLITDSSEDIINMVGELENQLATGLLLVVLVMFLFLGKTNSIFIALAIPFSLLISFIVFDYLGITLNSVVLFSLIMALGMLVDDAIVIVENIFRHMQEGMNRIDAVKSAADEVGIPVFISKLTTLSVFFPLLFWPGIMGGFMKYVPITMIVTLTASLFVALVFNPVICSSFMKVKKVAVINEDGDMQLGKMMTKYKAFIEAALNNRGRAMLATAVFLFLPIILYMNSGMGLEFFPTTDERSIIIKADTPQGTAAFATLENLMIIEQLLEGEENIDKVLTQVGSTSSRGGTGTNSGKVTVVYKPFEERTEPSPVTTERIRSKINSIPGSHMIIELAEDGPPTGAPISIEITGADFATIGEISQEIKDRIVSVAGLVDLEDDYIKSNPEIRLIVDREKASLLGLSTYSISNMVRVAMAGMKVGTYREGDDEYDIIVRLPSENRKSIDDIKNLQIPSIYGKYVPVSSVAEVELGAGFGQITRKNFNRVVNITAYNEGRNANQVLTDVQKIVSEYKLPDGYRITYSGQDQEQQESSAYLSKAFMLGIFLTFMILLVEFNSLTQVLIIMATAVISIGGVFWGLLITGTTFGLIMTGLGIISLAGIIINNGIILIDYTNKLRAKGVEFREAIVRSGVIRFRPVVLTAVTAVLGILPMSIGYSINFKTMSIAKGAEMSQFWAGMANAIIFGLTLATGITLIIVPVLYSFIGDKPKFWNAAKLKLKKLRVNIKLKLKKVKS